MINDNGICQKIEAYSMPVTETGCWIWMRSNKARNYGCIWYRNKTMFAHQVSWIAFKGEIPKGLCVLHHCDTPECVNPDHLFLGTHLDNMRDMLKKGRRKFLTTCTVPGCNGKHAARGMCEKHYTRYRRKK
jgi:hypothetical protein